jgi:hypothetical protein
MSWKWCRRKLTWSNLGYYPVFSWNKRENSHKTLLKKIIGVSAGFETGTSLIPVRNRETRANLLAVFLLLLLFMLVVVILLFIYPLSGIVLEKLVVTRLVKKISVARSSLLWYVTKRRLVVSYWRFGTNYPSHLKGRSSPTRMKMGPMGSPKHRYINTNIHFVTSQNIENCIYPTAGAWNHAKSFKETKYAIFFKRSCVLILRLSQMNSCQVHNHSFVL